MMYRIGTYFVYPKGQENKGMKIDCVSFEAAKSMFNEANGIADTTDARKRLWARRVA